MTWRKLLVGALVALLALLLAPLGRGVTQAADTDRDGSTEPAEPVELVMFYGDGCPYCAAEHEFLVALQERWPELVVREYEVWNDGANRALFLAMADERGIEARGVPTTFVGDRAWIGFNVQIANEIEATVAALSVGAVAPEPSSSAIVDVPLVGSVDVGDRSLVLATVLIGFVDGVNPCSLWVLSMLLALVLHSGSRARVLLVGAVFLVVTSLLYGLYMVGAYSALDYASEVSWIRIAVAAIAAVFGVLHLKEYVTHRGLSVTIPDASKPGIYARMRALARADRSLPAVLGGTAALAVGVSLVETPCTAGLPLLWTNLLADRDVAAAAAVALFVVYLGVFLLDELVIFTAAVVTLRAAKLQEHHGRALQLVSGTLMVALAATMLLAPDLLESLAGTAVVFALAGVVTAIVLVSERWWRPGDRAATGSGPRRRQHHPA